MVPSFRPSVFPCVCVQKVTPVSEVVSQYVTNKSFLVCVKSKKICILGHLQTPMVHEARRRQDLCITILGKAKLTCDNKTLFSVSSPPQSPSKAVVCLSPNRMFPRSVYFLVIPKLSLFPVLSLSSLSPSSFLKFQHPSARSSWKIVNRF